MLCGVVLCASALAGLRMGEACRQRERLLGAMIRDLERLREQMLLRGCALGEALRSEEIRLFSGMADRAAADGADAAWKALLAEDGGRFTALEPPEKQVMDAFWADLGLLIRKQQQNRFDVTLDALRRLHEQARADAGERSRLYGALGILLGLAVVILLW